MAKPGRRCSQLFFLSQSGVTELQEWELPSVISKKEMLGLVTDLEQAINSSRIFRIWFESLLIPKGMETLLLAKRYFSNPAVFL